MLQYAIKRLEELKKIYLDRYPASSNAASDIESALSALQDLIRSQAMDDVEIRSADEQAHRAQAQFSTLMLESAIQRGLVTQACYRAGRRDAQP